MRETVRETEKKTSGRN